ncbi:hypothetical protein V493_06293 [Pseudogymnoascus sp. VKM F-4281 (FW-2241)]|nr:hypothetical protein V493_06293 [Pseudogymnoascus sp. VKM F-4281 (FW-2241)]
MRTDQWQPLKETHYVGLPTIEPVADDHDHAAVSGPWSSPKSYGVNDDPSDPDAQWPYCPSYASAIAFTTLFAACTLAHYIQAFAYRKPFCWVVCMASTWETLGFTFRILGARNPLLQSWAVSSQLLILLTPLWVNAFVYMVVGRVVYFWLPEKRIWGIRAKSLTRWFVWFDVIVFLIQAGGGVMLSGTEEDEGTKKVKIGLNIYMTGIGVQQGVLLAFVALMITFHVRVLREGKHHETRWQPLLYTLYAALALISTRIIFRLVEFSSGINGPIPTNESYFYGLEATPMFLCLFSLAVIHPGRYLRGPGSEFAKPVVTKGARRWWCCCRRRRTVVDPDYDTPKREVLPQSDGEYSRHGDRSSDIPLTVRSEGVYDRHNDRMSDGVYDRRDDRMNDVPLTAQFPYQERV